MIRHADTFESHDVGDVWDEFPDVSASYTPGKIELVGTKKCLSGMYLSGLSNNVLKYHTDSSNQTDLGYGWVHLRLNVKFVTANRMVYLYWYDADEALGRVAIWFDSSYANRMHVRFNLYAHTGVSAAYQFDHYYPAISLDDQFHTIKIRFSKAKLHSQVDTETEQSSDVPADFGSSAITNYKVTLTGAAYYSYYEFHQTNEDIYGVDDYNQLLADGVAEPNVTMRLWEVVANPPTYTETSDAVGHVSLAGVANGDYYMAATSDGNYCWFQQIRVVSGEIQ